MVGVTKDEGTLLAYLNFPKLNDTLTKTDLTNGLKTLIYSGIDSELVSKFYLSNVNVENETALKQAFSASYGDLVITCPTHFFAEEFAKSSPKDSVYFYELTHKIKQKGILGCESDWMGICHGSDIGFVFGLPFLMPQFDSEVDRNFTKSVMSLWTNFAKTGYEFSAN
jgi:carboxylesterase type B